MIQLKENERIDDLELKGLKIIQDENGFCFGIDAVLLSDFAKNVKKDATVLDLGTGTGIIPILLSAKSNASQIIGIEKQEEVCEMSKRSVKLNKLENKIKIVNEDILNLHKIYNKNTIDVIVTNPPYKKASTGIINEEEKKIISRHETTANLEDFIKVSSELLKDKGEFYMIHRPERLVDILTIMRKYKIEPKEMRLVYSYEDKPPKMVLIKGVKCGKAFLKLRENLYIYKENGEYTDEIYKIYGKKRN